MWGILLESWFGKVFAGWDQEIKCFGRMLSCLNITVKEMKLWCKKQNT